MSKLETSLGKSLEELRSVAAAANFSDANEADLKSVLADVRAAERSLDSLITRIGVRSNELAALGGSAPADEILRSDGMVGASTARREAKRAVATETIPGLQAAVSSAEISGEHIDAIARLATGLSDHQRSEIDFERLIKKAQQLPPETFARIVKRQIGAVLADHGLSDTLAKRASSQFRHWFDDATGMGKFYGTLDPERYEVLANAVEHRMGAIAAAADESTTLSTKLAADALVELIAGGSGDRPGRLPSVTIIVDHQTITSGAHSGSIRQTESGHDLAPDSIARLCCDAVIRRVTTDEAAVPISVGRKYRTATDAQWAAIKTIHSTCAWSRCSAPITWCQAHHVHEWEHGGQTDLDNLIPLCSQHHHRVHEGKWHIKLLPDRTLKIYKPDGTHHQTVRPPQRC